MNERNVANIAQTRYSQYEGTRFSQAQNKRAYFSQAQNEGTIFMPEDKLEAVEQSNVLEHKPAGEHRPGHIPRAVSQSDSISPEIRRAQESNKRRLSELNEELKKPKAEELTDGVLISKDDESGRISLVGLPQIDKSKINELLEKSGSLKKLEYPENFDSMDSAQKRKWLKENGVDAVPAVAGGATGPDWADDLPDSDKIAAELGPYVDELKRLKDLIGVDFEAAQKELDLIRDHFTNSALDSKLGENEKGREEIRKAMQRAKDEISVRAQIEIDRRAAAGGMDEEFRESQYLYYGMTTMPKLKNLGRVDSLKHELGTADKLVNSLRDDEKISFTQADIDKIRTLSVDDLAKFKEGNSDEIKDKDIQKEIYRALKKDQDIWVHKKIESLPWENLDISRIGNNLSYREFSNAQNEMLPEVEEYSRGLSRGGELKYAFTKNGMEAMMSNSSVLRETLEVLSEKVHGWHEIASEIESFITREKLKHGEEQIPGLRKRWKEAMDHTKSNKSLTVEERWKLVRSTFRDEEFELMEKAAIGLYVYEENNDGSVRDMKPKKNREVAIDQQILGKGTNNDESWKVGGFVRFKDVKDVTKMREHLFTFAKEHLEKEAEKGTFTKEEVKARAKIAAFMGEWVFWRMKGRSAYWGEQGGKTSAAGAGKGENELFLVVGFQQYSCQESKGNGEIGRRMRKLAFGADTLGEYLDKYVPGMAGGVNMNLGLLDFYSQYSGFFPGERWNKPLQNAGFIRGYGKDQGEQVKRLNGYMKEVEGLMDSGVGNDEAWEIIRKKMSDGDKDFLEEYNNLPIVTLANKTSREALANIAKGKNDEDQDTMPYGDAPDYWGGDFAGPNKVRGLMVEQDSGFLSKPDAGMLSLAAQLSEGRKRVWQRAKLMKDMASTLLDFKSLWNKEITGRDNWNAGNADEFLTDVRNEGLVVDRNKKWLERDYYRKVVDKGLARLIPFADRPFVHKLSFIYAKKQGNIAFDTILAMILEWFKKFPSAMAGR